MKQAPSHAWPADVEQKLKLANDQVIAFEAQTARARKLRDDLLRQLVGAYGATMTEAGALIGISRQAVALVVRESA
jgi:hypothetical protein